MKIKELIERLQQEVLDDPRKADFDVCDFGGYLGKLDLSDWWYTDDSQEEYAVFDDKEKSCQQDRKLTKLVVYKQE